MRRLATTLSLLSLLALCGACRKPATEPPWTYGGEFHRTIARADRIVVRDGGFDGPRPVHQQKVLFQIAKPAHIRLVYDHLKFEVNQVTRSCACCGYPGIDWYRGKQGLAMTSVQHCRAIRWKDFPGDAALTKESGAWLKRWLMDHGIKENMLR